MLMTHSLITPITGLWYASATSDFQNFPKQLYYVIALQWIGGLVFEVARKIRMPHEHRESEDMYSKIIGVLPAIFLAFSFYVALVVIYVLFINEIGAGNWVYYYLGAEILAVVAVIIALCIQLRKNFLKLYQLILSITCLIMQSCIVITLW